MSFIEMRNIRKDFGKNTILHGVNMDLEKGKVISHSEFTEEKAEQIFNYLKTGIVN